MKADQYEKDLRVTKHSNRAVRPRIGWTLSEQSYTITRATGQYCKVQWDDSGYPEEIAVSALVAVGKREVTEENLNDLEPISISEEMSKQTKGKGLLVV